ncbi:MAG: hypothetical protein COB30_002605 [Ectothiorhodospiraceae bacterium]|nr:hypothetical protein [Ectothiorhodospiraceae bacterium]
MNIVRLLTTITFIAGLMASSWAFSGESTGSGGTAIQQMAKIMHRLKHYPSPQGKSELQVLISASETTGYERAIARAMVNLEHKVASKDVAPLKAIINDKASTQSERDLASIILNLDHRPSNQDKTTLNAMMK